MYNVWFMTHDNQKGVAVFVNTRQPLEFESTDDAYEFIQRFMSEKEHPKFMWVKEAKCKSSTT